MRVRDHDAARRTDMFAVDPRALTVQDGYNVRDLDSPDERADLDDLKEQIRANGVRVPLEVRMVGDEVTIVSGHRRHKVVMELIAEGEDIKEVPAITEPQHTGEADRIVNLVITNSGKPLKPLQIAEVVRRLTAFGWDKAEIAKRLGWKSASSVTQYLEMQAMPEGVKEHVRAGNISASFAKTIAKGTDPETAAQLIQANLDENKRIIGDKPRRTKVTPKTIKRDKPKAEVKVGAVAIPPAQAEPLESRVKPHERGAEGPIMGEAQFLETMGSQSHAADETLAGISPCTPVYPRGLPATQNQIPKPQGVKDLIDALEPFAKRAEDYDPEMTTDDMVVEIEFRHLKAAAILFAKVTGVVEDVA